MRVIDEVKDIRNILENLERLAEPLDEKDTKRRRAFELLCEPETGPLDRCLRELTILEEKIATPSWLGKSGLKRRAIMQVMGWQLKERDATVCLERIQRCKTTLALAITVDEV